MLQSFVQGSDSSFDKGSCQSLTAMSSASSEDDDDYLDNDECSSVEGIYYLLAFKASLNQVVHAKTTGLHLALCVRNSGAKSGRELFKGSKDATRLLVCMWKKFVGWGVRIFCEWRHKWRTFRPRWPTSPGPGPTLLDGSILLKFLLGSRPQSESFDTVDDLLGFQVQMLWSKAINIFDFVPPNFVMPSKLCFKCIPQ